MQDMLFLQEKNKEILEQENLKKKQMQDFERIRSLMENKPVVLNPNNNPSINTNINIPINNNMNTNNPNNILNTQRREEIAKQLEQMKQNINSINIPQKEISPQVMYDKSAQNIKKRNMNKEESTSTNSDKSEVEKTVSTKSTSSSVSSKKENSKIKSVYEKSYNSKNNESSYSKRKYKRNVLSVDTS